MKLRFLNCLGVWMIFGAASCQSTEVPHHVSASTLSERSTAETVPSAKKKIVYKGKASWYSIKTNGGTQTASGERLSDSAYTAAHPSLPMGSKVKVTNLKTGRSAVVRINDRGPFKKGRIIDVTKGVARHLGMVTAGVVPVEVELIKRG